MNSSNITNAANKYELLIEHIGKTIKRVTAHSKSREKTKGSTSRKFPTVPWWNDKCTGAVIDRKLALTSYKHLPSYSNFLEYKKKTAKCKKILFREKRTSWKNFCSNFNAKTPTSETNQSI